MLYRLDSEGANGYHWVFISYNPDWAHVRDKVGSPANCFPPSKNTERSLHSDCAI